MVVTFNETMSDLGEGIGALMTAIVSPVLMLIIGLGVGGAVVALIAGSIKGAKLR